MRQYNIGLHHIVKAVKESNKDIGAQTIEINNAEYLVRGLGYVKSIADIENAVVTSENYTSIRIKDIGKVSLGPQQDVVYWIKRCRSCWCRCSGASWCQSNGSHQ